MKKVLDNTADTKNYLESLRKVYIVACWAGYGVEGFPFSGNYADKEHLHPLVYQYDDHNGATDNYYLRDIYDTTTGHILLWTFSYADAVRIADKKNIDRGESWRIHK